MSRRCTVGSCIIIYEREEQKKGTSTLRRRTSKINKQTYIAMDQDNNGNPCNLSSGDDVGLNETRQVDGNFGQKRKRGDDFLSASSTTQIQDAGEAAVESLLLLGQRRKENQKTSIQQQQQQLEDIERYRLQNEQLRELKKQLQEKDEENIKLREENTKLREELEKEKQKHLQTDHSNDDQHKNTLDMYDVSTDTETDNDVHLTSNSAQLSSNSSMEQHQLLNFHQATRVAEVCADTLREEEDAVDDIAIAADANVEQEDEEGDKGDDDDGQLTIRNLAGEDGYLAFCCQNCRCTFKKSAQATLYKCVHSTFGENDCGNMTLFHRSCCCPGRGDKDSGFQSPMQVSRENGFGVHKKKKKTKTKEWSMCEVKKKLDNAKREEAKEANSIYLAAPDSQQYSDPVYVSYCNKFNRRKGQQKSPLRVLELFSGVGSGTQALKRLKIPFEAIHVDHDPIANEVCKFNHNEDGIDHVYIDTFEEIYGTGSEPDDVSVRKFVTDHGPIDLVLAGAPCQEYSGLNANRDANSENAQYLPNVGKLIQKLNEIQMNSFDVKHEVLFLSENVLFKERDGINACYGGISPFEVDAGDLGPVRRRRLYYLNIPVASIGDEARSVSVESVLDDGYGLVETLIDDGNDYNIKANTLLASLTRIDDDRMMKAKLVDQQSADHQSRRTKIIVEPYSVAERERMMGFEAGYVSKPVRNIFNEITMNGLFKPETSVNETYRDFMPDNLWYLRKKINLRCYDLEQEPYFGIKIATPLESKRDLSYFTEEEYCKHLIGNAWSIVTVEHLLRGLVELFPKGMLKTYDACDYAYPWIKRNDE